MVKLKVIRLKASTLLEVIVAMVIILIIFVLATGIFTKVIGSSPSIRQQKIRSLISTVILESSYTRNWLEETVVIDGVTLHKTAEQYMEYPDLLLISVVAMEEGKEIGKARQVVRKDKNDAQ